jgi:glycosyltransferase involved in cell wall biosynthesis
MERYICRRADHLALVAAHFAPELAAYGVAPSRTTLIYNGSDFDSAESPTDMTGGPKMLYIGRFDWHKRAHLLLQAWPEVQRHFPAAELWLIGAGEQSADLHNLATALGVGSGVHLPGWLPHAHLRQVYAQATGLCLPSMSEGLSKVILEAMSLAVPVLASDIPANRDVLDGGALGALIAEATPQAWAEAIASLLAQPEPARRRARQAQAVVRQRYRWAHVAARLDDAYAQLVGRR